MKYLIAIFLVSLSALTAEEPWGCDAELAYKPRCGCCQPVHRGPLERMMRGLVCFHKRVISPADGPRSHFKPSSSEYMLHAVEKYGFFRGYLMGCDRLMRENKDPWVYPTITGDYGLITKWDPVK
jgi:putative component of membrane protein insertase Oxa1/YidC/SpoIIIJ protein YidD